MDGNLILPGLTALVVAGVITSQAWASPRFALGLWWAVMLLVPYWLEPRVGFLWPPQAIIGVLLLPAIYRYRDRSGTRIGDGLLLVMVALVVLAWRFGGGNRGEVEQLLVQGCLGYLIGRTLVKAAGEDWFYAVVRWSGLLLAVWGLAERFLGIHLFEHLVYGPEGSTWSQLHFRGGHVRSDAAFGHPIVLGAFLAFSVPFIASWKISDGRKIAALGLIGAGLYTTASRGAVLSAILGVVLVVFFGGRALTRNGRVGLLLITLFIVLPLTLALEVTFSSGGQEVASSSAYRQSLYSLVLQDIHPLSVAANTSVDVMTGQHLWRAFGSIDSTFIASSLDFGWLPVALLIAGLVGIAARALTRRASLMQLALLAQIPTLATVALITQYRTFAFFLAGAATALPYAQRVSAEVLNREAPVAPLTAGQPAPVLPFVPRTT